jgi:ATP-dependent DNA ligase
MIFYPPKPTLISHDQPLFARLEHTGDTVAEPKYNGSRLILQILDNESVEFWNRSGAKMAYSPSAEVLTALDRLIRKLHGYTVFDGELMHFKTKNIKHQIIIFDIFIHNGEWLRLKPFGDRRKILEGLIGKGTNEILLAPQFQDHYREHYAALIRQPEIEGLVIKKLGAPLTLGDRESPVVNYMFKVRKPGPNYRF